MLQILCLCTMDIRAVQPELLTDATEVNPRSLEEEKGWEWGWGLWYWNLWFLATLLQVIWSWFIFNNKLSSLLFRFDPTRNICI